MLAVQARFGKERHMFTGWWHALKSFRLVYVLRTTLKPSVVAIRKGCGLLWQQWAYLSTWLSRCITILRDWVLSCRQCQTRVHLIFLFVSYGHSTCMNNWARGLWGRRSENWWKKYYLLMICSWLHLTDFIWLAGIWNTSADERQRKKCQSRTVFVFFKSIFY